MLFYTQIAIWWNTEDNEKILFWVAVAVVGGLIVEYALENGVFEKEEHLSPVVEPAGKPQPEHDPTPEISQKTKPQPVKPSPGVEPNNIREAFRLALKISSSSERDSALQGLVNVTLENDLPMAIRIAGSISSSSTRDSAYTQIIDQALSKSDLQTAEIAAGKISSISKRASQLQKILRANHRHAQHTEPTRTENSASEIVSAIAPNQSILSATASSIFNE